MLAAVAVEPEQGGELVDGRRPLGLKLPASFKVTHKPPAGILPMTKTDPALAGGSGAISHNISATWDCCSKDKDATKKTKIATT